MTSKYKPVQGISLWANCKLTLQFYKMTVMYCHVADRYSDSKHQCHGQYCSGRSCTVISCSAKCSCQGMQESNDYNFTLIRNIGKNIYKTSIYDCKCENIIWNITHQCCIFACLNCLVASQVIPTNKNQITTTSISIQPQTNVNNTVIGWILLASCFICSQK